MLCDEQKRPRNSKDVDTMYKPIVVSGIAAILAGCAATAERVQLPNGRQGYAVENCDSLSRCYRKAAEVCGGLYDIVNKSTEAIAMPPAARGVSIPLYSMVIECKSSH